MNPSGLEIPAQADLKNLRRRLRNARRSIPGRQRQAYARAIRGHLVRDPLLMRARRIAAYWPADGEPDPVPVLEWVLGRGGRAYLPVLRTEGRRKLWFVRYRPGEPMRPNRFRIPEPRRRGRHILPPRHIDLLLLPLVGFDDGCRRIGMGGGFYDRTLAYLRRRALWRRPLLVGVAHACQRVDRIEPMPWDVPLDAVVTELGLHWCRGHRAADRPVDPAGDASEFLG